MKNVYVFVLLCCSIVAANAQIKSDKALHFLGGNLYGLVGAGIASEISKADRTWTFVGAVGGSLLIGLAKEGIDKAQYDGWDNDDLYATILGGATVGVTIDIFKQRKKRRRAKEFKEAIETNKQATLELYRSFENTNTSLYVLAISPNVLNRN